MPIRCQNQQIADTDTDNTDTQRGDIKDLSGFEERKKMDVIIIQMINNQKLA